MKLRTALMPSTDIWLWRVVLPGSVVAAAVLMFVGLDGDDYFLFTAVRRASPREFSQLLWPATGLTFRAVRIGAIWLQSWVPGAGVGFLRVIASLVVIPTAILMYHATKRIVHDGRGAAFATLWTLCSASFPFPWSYTGNVFDPFWFFLGLLCWLRWWDHPTRGRLALALATNAVGLMNYELQLAMTPVAYLALLCADGSSAIARARGTRLIGLGLGILPLLI